MGSGETPSSQDYYQHIKRSPMNHLLGVATDGDSMSCLQMVIGTEGQQILSNIYEKSMSHLDYFCISPVVSMPLVENAAVALYKCLIVGSP